MQQQMGLSLQDRQAILDREVAGYVRSGFIVQMRTETTAQLVKPKKFSLFWALLWLILGIGAGFIIYILWYASRRDESVYLEVDERGKVHKR